VSSLPILQTSSVPVGCAVPFLAGLNEPSSQSLERASREISYPANAMLFVEGQLSRGVMVIVSGQVKLSTAAADGRTVIVRLAETGDVLGLSTAVAGLPCELTAETMAPTRIKLIPRESFRQWLRTHPELAFGIAQELAEEYNNTCHQLRTMLLSHTAAQRLARTLLQLVRNATPGKEARARLSLTHQQMAEMIGASRETVTRLLSSFRHKGIIEIEDSTLLIHDCEKLREIGCGDGAGFGF
jgi:CRP/FNR family transcriptional regulator, cyclic AMP receptor protein